MLAASYALAFISDEDKQEICKARDFTAGTCLIEILAKLQTTNDPMCIGTHFSCSCKDQWFSYIVFSCQSCMLPI